MITYDISQIMEILPHRYPFLLVDKIIELELDKIGKPLNNLEDLKCECADCRIK